MFDVSESGHVPDGIDEKLTYNVIDSGVDNTLSTNQIKLAQNETDALADNFVTLNNKGGIIKIESRVADKLAGDVGHPVQYDSTESQWYVNAATPQRTISTLRSLVLEPLLLDQPPRTFIKRRLMIVL